MTKYALVFLLLARIALAANANDETTVRTAYGKLAYAVQSRIVVMEATRNRDLTIVELNKVLQANELRFEITAMSSGLISEIDSRPYSDFVTKPGQQKVLQMSHESYSVSEFGKLLAVSLVANPHWTTTDYRPTNDDWNMSIKQALALGQMQGKYSRYVTATITVRFQRQSRTYHALWLFSDSDLMEIDLVTDTVGIFAKESAFPTVLTDTSLRVVPAVRDWLTSTQSFDTSCKAGKLDVCCDSAMRCGVLAEDLRNTKAPLNPLTEGKIQ